MLHIFLTLVFGVLSLFISTCSADPGARVATPNNTPSSTATGIPAFVFAGESTMCRTGPIGPQDPAPLCASVDGGTINGWGQGFLNTFNSEIDSQSSGFGSGNDTLTVYRTTLAWIQVLNVIGNFVAYQPSDQVYSILAFGHLDQKSPRARASFSTDLNGAIDDIGESSVLPILVTPLTNRAFKNGKVIEDLVDVTKDTIDVAKARGCTLIDLNAASTKYINTIGEEAAAKYDPSPSDKTNLTSHGGVVFGRMVNDLLIKAIPELEKYTIPNETLSKLLRNGIPT